MSYKSPLIFELYGDGKKPSLRIRHNPEFEQMDIVGDNMSSVLDGAMAVATMGLSSAIEEYVRSTLLQKPVPSEPPSPSDGSS